MQQIMLGRKGLPSGSRFLESLLSSIGGTGEMEMKPVLMLVGVFAMLVGSAFGGQQLDAIKAVAANNLKDQFHRDQAQQTTLREIVSEMVGSAPQQGLVDLVIADIGSKYGADEKKMRMALLAEVTRWSCSKKGDDQFCRESPFQYRGFDSHKPIYWTKACGDVFTKQKALTYVFTKNSAGRLLGTPCVIDPPYLVGEHVGYGLQIEWHGTQAQVFYDDLTRDPRKSGRWYERMVEQDHLDRNEKVSLREIVAELTGASKYPNVVEMVLYDLSTRLNPDEQLPRWLVLAEIRNDVRLFPEWLNCVDSLKPSDCTSLWATVTKAAKAARRNDVEAIVDQIQGHQIAVDARRLSGQKIVEALKEFNKLPL